MGSDDVSSQLKNLRKWQKTKESLSLQTKWRVGMLFHLKPKREKLEKIFSDLGLRVTAFDHAEQLFEYILKNNDIRIVFCDWEPQKETDNKIGTEFLAKYQRFKKLNPSVSAIPIVLVTYHFTGNDLMPAMRLGAKDILIMPTTSEIVGEKVLKNIFKVEEKQKVLKETEVQMDRAEEFIRTGNYRAAIKIYEEVVQEHGEAAEVIEKQAEAYLRAGQVEEAIVCFSKCVAIEKSNARAHQGLGNCFSQLGLHRKAREQYKKVLAIEPDNAFVDHKIGQIYLAENNVRGAERHFEEATKRNPHFFEIYDALAKIKCDYQQPRKAAEILGGFLNRYPDEMRGHIRLAETLIEAERYQEAENAVRNGINQAIKENYEPPVALYNRWGIALRKQEKHLEAIQKYEAALKIEPDNPEIYFNIAKAQFESGDEGRNTVKKFEKCFSLDPTLKEDFWEDALLKPLHEYFPRSGENDL